MTGLSNSAEGLDGKRVELLVEAAPGLARVDILWHEPPMLSDFRRTQAAIQVSGLQPLSMSVGAPDEIPAAFALAMSNGAQTLVTVSNGLTASARQSIVELASRHRLPTMFQTNDFVESGGPMAYGPSLQDQHRRAASDVDRILKGAGPRDLPVEQPTRFDFVVNLKTAGAPGLAIRSSVLAQATQLVQ